ncbi:pre-mRNA-processing-splicing factor 8 [Ramicandelaber brevisporus]|nr:pre-mRNA-processing-splicing factor 8 [Ramicandelaber brevisporus]
MEVVDLEAKARKWRKLNSDRYGAVGTSAAAGASASSSASRSATSGSLPGKSQPSNLITRQLQPKPMLPVESARQLHRDRGDMSSKKFKQDRRPFLGALKLMPHAIFNLLQSIPQPWEPNKHVNVAYHVGGALTLVDDTSAAGGVAASERVIEPLYVAQWASTVTMMRREKVGRVNFKRTTFPVFDDDEPPIDYTDNILGLNNSEEPGGDVIQMDLDPKDDAKVFQWFYENKPLDGKSLTGDRQHKLMRAMAAAESSIEMYDEGDDEDDDNENGTGNGWEDVDDDGNALAVNGPTYKRWSMDVSTMDNLRRLATPLSAESTDPNSFYLFNPDAFITAKSIGVVLPGGPKFDVTSADGNKRSKSNVIAMYEDDEDWTEFNDVYKIIVRNCALRAEQRVAFPHLYNSVPRQRLIKLGWYHYPLRHIVSPNTDDDYDIERAFFFDESLHPIVAAPSKNAAEQNAASWVAQFAAEDEAELFSEECTEFALPKPHPRLHRGVATKHYGRALFDETALSTRTTSPAIELYWAPYPFDSLTGRTRRAHDIQLIAPWYLERVPQSWPVKCRVSAQRLIKSRVNHELTATQIERANVRNGGGGGVNSSGGGGQLLRSLKATKFFQSTRMDWVEAGLQVVRQGHTMLNLLIKRRRLDYLHLDYNFNLKPTRTLTTKERKKSRFGASFHMMRELLRLIKLVVDVHVKHRLGEIDSFQLADGLQYLFAHVGQLTGIYQHKYGVMRQVKLCKDLKHAIYYRFNVGPVPKGPGVGLWSPMWRVWLFYMRGTIPTLERWLSNLLARQFEGRAATSTAAATVTKQRVESQYDLELRASVMHDILDMMPPAIRKTKSRAILAHLSEAWRCWKANKPWNVEGMPAPVTALINKYVRQKADWWVRQAHLTRGRIANGTAIDKIVFKKNLGRISRLWMRAEHERQESYRRDGPYIGSDDAVNIYRNTAQWLALRRVQPIKFPPLNYKHDNKLLILALESLRSQYNVQGKLTGTQREELAMIEQAYDNPAKTLANIKRTILTRRAFANIEMDFFDTFEDLIPVQSVASFEKIVDAYLDQYLWLEASRNGLFPHWTKPSDSEPAPLLVYKLAGAINNLEGVWDTSNGARTVFLQSKLSEMNESVDLMLFNRLLRLIVDPSLADYMTAKNNVKIQFMDMEHTNHYGLIKGLQFSGFLMQYYGLVIDLLLLGIPRAMDLAGPVERPHTELGQFQSKEIESAHPIRVYMRYLDQIYLLMRFDDPEDARKLSQKFLADHPELGSYAGNSGGGEGDLSARYPNRRTWPRDARMRMVARDMLLGRAVFWEMKRRLPPSIATLEWNDHGKGTTLASVYSKDNPSLLMCVAGFDVRMVPRSSILKQYGQQTSAFVASAAQQSLDAQEAAWHMINSETKERTAVAHVRVSPESLVLFNNNIRRILMSSGSAPFIKVAKRWNTLLTGFVTYYREAIVYTREALELMVRAETKIQRRVMSGLNSKMPSRFPPVIFYTPEELGGLGMMSMGNIMVPSSDKKWSKITEQVGVTHYKSGMSKGGTSKDLTAAEGAVIPNLLRYVLPWQTEFIESQRAWTEFAVKRKEAISQNRRLTLDDLEDSWDRGVPRLSTLFSRDRQTLAYDRGWRLRGEMKQYQIDRFNPFYFTNNNHDGKLWSFHQYRTDVVQALGGVETILEHTLFAATGHSTWQGLFWSKSGGTSFEEAMKYKQLTNAQRSGLSQIPNRRFTLWWSPTINRAHVYIGFKNQLDLTGIFMHGKLPTLKISMIQLMRSHLWQKIHESLVMDLCQVLDQNRDPLRIMTVQREQIHPRKSYKMNASCADITLFSATGQQWPISTPSWLNSTLKTGSEFTDKSTSKVWLDIQLSWGNYDEHDIERYARSKFAEYTSDGISVYPSKTGLIIVIDLAYNTYSAFGTWIPGLKQLVQQALAKIMKANPALHMLRERVRKSLQLYSSEPTEPLLNSTNYAELFSAQTIWFIDDTNVYRVTQHKTQEGNLTTKPVNGALLILNPRTGQMYMKIIHTSTWIKQKRIGQLAKWKPAEEVAALVRSLSPEDQPQQVVVARRGIMDPLGTMLLDFSNIAIRPSELQIPFKSLLLHEEIEREVFEAQEPKMIIYNVFDDWTDTVSPLTAFSRLILILRAFKVNPDRAKVILRPDRSVKVLEGHLWPNLSASEWERVEVSFRDLILADYGKRNSVNTASLTQAEVRDIILGMEIRAPGEERQQLANQMKQSIQQQQQQKQQQQQQSMTATPQAGDQLMAMTTKTVNAQGEQIVVTTTTNYESQRFVSQSDWRVRALASQSLHEHTRLIEIANPDDEDEEAEADDTTADIDQQQLQQQQQQQQRVIVMPQNLLKKFVQIADTHNQIAGFMYGRSPNSDHPEVKEIRCIAIVPQWSTRQVVHLPLNMPAHSYLNASTKDASDTEMHGDELEPLGWIHTLPSSMVQSLNADNAVNGLTPQMYLTPHDVITHSLIVSSSTDKYQSALEARNSAKAGSGKLPPLPPQPLRAADSVVMSVALTPGSCTLSATRITAAGMRWGSANSHLINAILDPAVPPAGFFSSTFSKPVHVLLTQRFMGCFLVPNDDPSTKDSGRVLPSRSSSIAFQDICCSGC